MRNTILAVAVFFGGAALACQFNTDCEVGSRCVKSAGQLYGVCMGGMAPGNSGDKVPVHEQSGDNTGKTCSFNVDCGAGGTCLKESGQLQGVCMGGR